MLHKNTKKKKKNRGNYELSQNFISSEIKESLKESLYVQMGARYYKAYSEKSENVQMHLGLAMDFWQREKAEC